MAGRDQVVAGGVMNKIQVASTSAMSDETKAKAQRRLTEPGSGS